LERPSREEGAIKSTLEKPKEEEISREEIRDMYRTVKSNIEDVEQQMRET